MLSLKIALIVGAILVLPLFSIYFDLYQTNIFNQQQSNVNQPINPTPSQLHLLDTDDSDNDGLTNDIEKSLGTNPLLADSDSDGLEDLEEVNTYRTNPILADSDGDGLSDGLEVNGWSILVNGQQIQVTSDPKTIDTDADSLNDAAEFSTYYTNPRNHDTDSDGLPDNWETAFYFSPASSDDAFSDPDLDGLTNVEEYRLGTITDATSKLSFKKDLFIEIDYMLGCQPTETALSYLSSYYRNELGIRTHVVIDDCVSDSQLTAIGVTPGTLSSEECLLIEEKFHDSPTTHVYVFYGKRLWDSTLLGWANGVFGAFLSIDTIRQESILKMVGITDDIRVEKAVLLHELGHTLNIISRDSNGQEDYCGTMGCIMAGSVHLLDFKWVYQLSCFNSDYPRYCESHLALLDLTNKWSVDESWR